MIKSISLYEAVTQVLMSDVNKSFISMYEISVLLYKIIKKQEHNGRPIRIKEKRLAQKSDVSRVVNKLLLEGILIKLNGISKHTLAFAPRYQIEKKNPNKLICQADPFLFISHLSAMAYHGLTDRLPTPIFCTSLSPSNWSERAARIMKKELGEEYDIYTQKTDLHTIKRVHFDKGKFLGKPVELLSTSNIDGSFINTRDDLRVSTIGRTFRDMLRKPDMCGGISHVMEVYEEHAELYLNLIIEEINQHGTQIEKARAGYLIEDVCGIENESVERWLSTVQRGGSRKLDPQAPFDSQYSDRWGLSINV